MTAIVFIAAATALGCSGELQVTEKPSTGQSAISNTVRISDKQFIYHAYEVLLERAPDPGGFETYLSKMRAGVTRSQVFDQIIASGEFQGNPALRDREQYIERVYDVLLERPVDSGGLDYWAGTLGDAGQPGAYTWHQVFSFILGSGEYRSQSRPIAGVHFPLPIDPALDVSNADYVQHAYRLVLGRAADSGGLETYRGLIEGGWSRQQVWQTLLGSGEFQSNPALHDRAGYVTRGYETILGRTPSPAEVQSQLGSLKSYDGQGTGRTWLEFYQTLVASTEFRANTCHSEYYTYGERIDRGTPLLRDVASGDARFDSLGQSTRLSTNLNGTSADGSWDEKLAYFKDPATGDYYAAMRGFDSDTQTHNIYLMESTGADHTVLTNAAPVFEKDDATHLYDPHISIDDSVCPKRYVMTMECSWPGLGSASLCVSYSTTPTRPASWSSPTPVIKGCLAGEPGCGNGIRSASTGISLFDHGRPYVSWTEVDDGATWFVDGNGDINPEDGDERTSTGAAYRPDVYGPQLQSVGDYANPYTMLAEPNPYCTSSWDCNNRDAQDWKQEGPYFYKAYNGGNYYRCKRPDGDASHSNQWQLSLARSTTPTGHYTEVMSSSQRIVAERDDVCGISYPMVNVIDGKLHLTYAYYPAGGGNHAQRSSLRWD